jgi:hypothetical protein
MTGRIFDPEYDDPNPLANLPAQPIPTPIRRLVKATRLALIECVVPGAAQRVDWAQVDETRETLLLRVAVAQHRKKPYVALRKVLHDERLWAFIKALKWRLFILPGGAGCLLIWDTAWWDQQEFEGIAPWADRK